MLLLEPKVRSMSKMGRPRKGEENRPTSQVRIFKDVAEMVKWVCEVEGIQVAAFLDPMLRAHVVSRYSANLPMIRQLHAARKLTDPLPAVAILTGRETPEQVRAILEAADEEHKAFMESGEAEAEAEEPVKPKRKKKSS